MNIILLSGGSGQRLWPLSNTVRSKQFIKLFRSDDGHYESMLQRVCRQIKKADSKARIVIATGKSQVSEIRNQVGDSVDICVEPERRDTMAAIALATSFLAEKTDLHDESVIVCPVDPYVDDDYFEMLGVLDREIYGDAPGLYLMGVEPTYPSAKYGYIIPENNSEVSRVTEFREKPDTAAAADYIARGALWNCGVFGFRMSYILEKSQKILGSSRYEELFEKYEALPKISFDYAVAEKEKNIRVLRFKGQWKDIGTWNTFAESMAEPVIGQALLDDYCTNVNVVNELGIPVVCMGLKDAVVAVSNDGVLVTDKERSGYLKAYVEKINDSVRYAEKSWGTFTVLDVTPESMTVKAVIMPGKAMSYHSHEERMEIWNVVSGEGEAVIDGVRKKITAGDSVTICRGARHSLRALTQLALIEIQQGSAISVHDKTKYEWNW